MPAIEACRARKKARDSVCKTASRHESKCVRGRWWKERRREGGTQLESRMNINSFARGEDQTLRPERRGPRDNYATCDHRVRNQRRIDWKSLRRRAARFLAAAGHGIARSLVVLARSGVLLEFLRSRLRARARAVHGQFTRGTIFKRKSLSGKSMARARIELFCAINLID